MWCFSYVLSAIMVMKRWTFCVLIIFFVIILIYNLSVVQQLFQFKINVLTVKSNNLTTEMVIAAATQGQISSTTSGSQLKKILIWNKYFNMPHFGLGGIGQKPFKNSGCPVNNCFIADMADGHLEMPIEDYDAVLFHVYYMNRYHLPSKRKPHQRYVFFLLESPQTVSVNSFPANKDYFNWTMTYRHDSDIWRPYGWLSEHSFSKHETPSPVDIRFINPQLDRVSDRVINISHKKHLVAWFVSHCNVASKRDDYVKELSKYIPVHIFGKCGPGHYSCPRDGSSDKCYELLHEQYKFYLSFENSLCRDYVTEKLFVVIKFDVVPVVYGGANYTKIMPPMSYIDARDFSNPKELANYLLYLDKNAEEYRKYFWWKDYFKIYTWHSYVVCKMCEMLNNSSLPNKVYSDIREWWGGEDVCQLPKDHFKETFWQ